MKNNPTSWLRATLTIVMMALLWGCATTETTETLLTRAGFKTVPATTPQQEEHLRSLSAHKVTKVVRNAKEYFVYPDREHHMLYVGQNEQYERYRNLKATTDVPETPAAALETEWSLWGGW